MNKEKLISVLIRLLTEPRDGLILINGSWGVGKTYFLQKEFKKLYDKAPHFYMSTLGLNSLQDFKDRIVSITYLDNSSEINKLSDLTASATSALTQEESVGKFAEQIMSTFAGAIKDYVLKDLRGVFIIDDLERIPQELREEIATYCLQHYQNNKNLDYILVGNFSTQSSEILSHKEKIISDEIYFSFNNITEILEKKLDGIPQHQQKIIIQVIGGFEETNLRIINRIIFKLLPFIEIPPLNTARMDADIENLVSSLCAHIILKEKFSYQESDFHDKFISSPRKILTPTVEDDAETISQEESNLLNITAYKNYNNMMAPYCFNIISQQDISPYIFTKIQPLQKKDYAALARPEINDIQEKDYVEAVKNAILKLDTPTLSTWLTATSNYLRLSQSGYIPKIKGLTKDKIESIKHSFNDIEIITYFKETYKNIDDLPLRILRRDNDELHDFFLNKYIDIIKKNKINTLIEKMNKFGWAAIDLEVYQSDFKYKPLETLGLSDIASGIKNSWSIHDIQLFSNHLSSLYNFSNLSDFLADELPFLKQLHSTLNSHQKKIPNSFRRGAIIELRNCVEKVKDLLEINIARKLNTP
ncbi:ATP-binding protein [Hafnia alvei]|uniref:P-loop NTPase fold protein n=1 Tax=Hafnia alvei TaxID=569 RepID=UPI001F3AA838|nr:P-loop NTPase fold protein [Hafnia alvei]MCE9872408.1 ATP-binding protein [Hafnia alvei]